MTARFPWWHPAHLLATWFGSGLLPVAPGTWGSLAALPFAWGITWLWGPLWLIAASAVLFVAGWWAANLYLARLGGTDPGPVVVDEVVGQWLTLAVVPPDFWAYCAGFALFRLADIGKPWPASWADKEIKGGLGVMIDDVIAGIYAAFVLLGVLSIAGK
ncbi:MAG: phosphatidylglycerophosphatase A [Alphaproteobacteria bacterium]|nr:phosphatidylglycerophosphatase A [Alphaproteobacteria bacterium]